MFSYLRTSRQRKPVPSAEEPERTSGDEGDHSGHVEIASPSDSNNGGNRDITLSTTTGADKNTSANTPSPSSPSQPSASARAIMNTSFRDTSSPSPHRRVSSASEGYPSWLPKRPPPPPPASTFHSSVGMIDFDHEFGVMLRDPREDAQSQVPHDRDGERTPRRVPIPFFGGRKPTPRSVRIVSLQGSPTGNNNAEEAGLNADTRHPAAAADRKGRRRSHKHGQENPTASSLRGPSPGPCPVLSRANGACTSAAAQAAALSTPSHPRFNARGLHLQIFRSPSKWARFYFYLFPLLVFAHFPIQTFLDLNAVFILVQVSKYPNPLAPGIPGSGRNWALGAAAYVASWLVWILVVSILYEVIYSFFRRWRLKRPAMMPLYLSSSAFNYVCMTSYTNFCFMQHLRLTAFTSKRGSIRDGLAETFYFYSQNLPTVILLLPRAALCLALVFAYGTPLPDVVLANTNVIMRRDPTFFNQDGSLSAYATAILIVNAAWTAWRIMVLLCSWVGLWILSEEGCAGLCGPRYRWEEEEVEKRRYSYLYGDAGSEDLGSTLAWSWRQCTRMRIRHAFEFCLTIDRPQAWAEKDDGENGLDAEGVAQVMAAIGFPAIPPPVRPSVLSGDLFQDPKRAEDPDAVIPKVLKRSSRERQQLTEPYPFTMRGAQISSSDKMVPFPPSPTGSGDHEESSSSAATSGSTHDLDATENPTASSHKTRETGSLSSFGQPVSSRYPFQFRQSPNGGNVRATTRREESDRSTTNLPSSGSSAEVSSQSNEAAASQSSVNVSSTESSSHATTSSEESSSGSGSSSSIPMPPRHPQPAERRARARGRTGTGPDATPATSSTIVPPIVFPRTQVIIPTPLSTPSYDEQRHQLGADDQSIISSNSEDDSVGLLSPAAALSQRSPRASLMTSVISNLRGTTSTSRTQSQSSAVSSGTSSSPMPPSSPRSYRSSLGSLNVSVVGGGGASARSRSRGARSRTTSASAYVRSRAQSLMQGIGAASQSSIELVHSVLNRSRTESMARLDEGEHEQEGSVVGDSLRVPRSRLHSHRSGENDNNDVTIHPHDNGQEGDDSFEHDDRISGLYDVQLQHADLAYNSDQTHARNASGGSGSVMSSSNENYTFGQPMPHRTRLQQVGEGQTVQEEVEEQDPVQREEGHRRSRVSSHSVVMAGVQRPTPDSSSGSSRSASSRQRTRAAHPALPALSPMRPRTYHTTSTAMAAPGAQDVNSAGMESFTASPAAQHAPTTEAPRVSGTGEASDESR